MVMFSSEWGELCATMCAGLSELQHSAGLLRQSEFIKSLPTLEAPSLGTGLQQADLHTIPELLQTPPISYAEVMHLMPYSNTHLNLLGDCLTCKLSD